MRPRPRVLFSLHPPPPLAGARDRVQRRDCNLEPAPRVSTGGLCPRHRSAQGPRPNLEEGGVPGGGRMEGQRRGLCWRGGPKIGVRWEGAEGCERRGRGW
eukprot:scaffold7666_cov39-Isochrysis_galbana.AAC.1